ncbi:MAG: DJ-1/PfpI family protein [Clostridia bacterium]|nr:DJ-1/PfpI family protein [Clostridia bacterium]
MLYLFLAEGFEEIEALGTLDVLRRAGVETKTVGVTGPVVTGSHGIPVTADLVIEDAVKGQDLDGVILPGGMPGTKNLEASDLVKDFLRYCRDNGLLTAAICAAPSVLGHLGYLNGKKATCFPGFETELTGAVYTADSVTEDGNVITGKGAGAAHLFGEAIAARYVGREAAHTVLANMQYEL